MFKKSRVIVITFFVLCFIPCIMAWSIDFASPSDGMTSNFINRDYILVNVTSSAINTANITIDLYNADWSIINTSSTSLDNFSELFANFSGLPEGLYYINVTAIDNNSDSNVNTTNVTIDFINPSIGYSYLTDNGTPVNRPYILINVSANDTNLNNISSFIYNSSFDLINSTTIITTENNAYLFFNQSVLVDGIYYFNATAYDKAGNIGYTELLNITIDTTAPNITIISPVNKIYNTSSIDFNITLNEIGLCNYSLDLGENSILDTIDNLIFHYTNTSITEGNHRITIYCIDAAYNTNFKSTTFTIDTTAPYFTSIPLNDIIYYGEDWIGAYFNARDDTSVVSFSINNSTLFTINASGYLNDVPTLPIGIYVVNITINDSAGNTNWTTYKLTVQNITAPIIIQNSPTNNPITNKNYILLNVTIYDSDLLNLTVWFFANSSLINTTYNRLNGTSVTYNWTSLPDGAYNWTAIVGNGIENSTNTYSYFIIDTTKPSIIINTPTNITYNTTIILINIISDDANIDKTWFFNGTTNQTYSGPINITYTEGAHTITAWTNDSAGNINSTSKTFSISIEYAPTITINSPNNNSNITANYTRINATIYDKDQDNITVWLYLDGNLTSTYYNLTNGTTIIYNWTELPNGMHNWTIITNDGTTNSTIEYRYFTINTNVTAVQTPSISGGTKSSSSSVGSGSGFVYIPSANDNPINGAVIFSQYLPKPSKGNQTINVNMIGMPISYVSLNFNADTNNSDTLKLISQEDNPTNTSISAPIYTYILVNTSMKPFIDEIYFKFKINKSWISQNNITEDNITIYYYDDNDSGWNTVKASRDSEDTGYIYYSSSTKSITNFAIGGPTIGKIEAKKTLIEEQPVIINSTNDTTDSLVGNSNSVNNTEKSIFFKRIGMFLTNAKNIFYDYIIKLDPDTQELIVISLSSILILIVGVVSGVLAYKNTIKPRRIRKIREYNKNILSRTITPYSEEPALAQQTMQSTEQKSVTPVHIEETRNKLPVESGPEFSISKINELLAQCEYALDNGRVEEANKYYDEARVIYFNSGLDYEKKSKVYTKIIELHNILNKK